MPDALDLPMGLAALDEFAKANRPIPLPTSGRAVSIASMRAAQGVDSEGNAKKGEQIPGGLASGKKPEDFPAEALEQGIKVELEHTKDRKVAREIAMDHLTEDPAYYEKLARMESGKTPAAPEPKSKVDRALLKLLKKNPKPEDEQVHALATKLGVPKDELEERAYALLAQARKEKPMDAKKSGLDGLAEFAGAEPMEKSGREDSIYDRWHRYDFNAGSIVRTARDWASGFWCTRPAGIALRARAFRVAERLADLTREWGALKAQERQTRTDYENETPAQRSARHEQEEAQWKTLEAQVEPVLEEARECDRELLRIRSLEAQQEAGEASAAKSMPPWEDLQKSFYESKDVLEWTGGFWDDKFKARAAELAKKLLAHRQKRRGDVGTPAMAQEGKGMSREAKEEDKIIREMHALEIEWLEAEKKKAEKRAKVGAATKSLNPGETRLAPGVDCTRQPHAAVAHAQAVIDSRVRAARDAGVTLGTPGPTPPPAPPAPVADPLYVQKGGGMVVYGTGADREASELAKGGGFYHGQAPRLPGLEAAQCPACGGGLVKAVTDCPHCGALASAPPPTAVVRVEPGPAREGQPRLRPTPEQVVDGRNGLTLDAE